LRGYRGLHLRSNPIGCGWEEDGLFGVAGGG
jgi:hypothetical protein